MLKLKEKLRRRFLHWVLRDLYYGVIDEDFIDVGKMSEAELSIYAKRARAVLKAKPFLAELGRIRHVQERELFEKARTPEDLIFGKGVLHAIRLILDRFEALAAMAEVEDLKEGMYDGQLY
mgnify:CR=1 FL=1